MGQEGLLALLGYFLMAISAFLPWATVSTVFGQIQMTGLQVAQGVPGIILLAVGLFGGLTTLVPKKTSWTGFSDLAIGIIVLWETGDDMSNIARIAEEATTSYVRADLGSGGYLAMVAGSLVIVAGLVTLVKVRSARQTVRAISAHAKPRTGLRGPFLLNEQTVNEEVGYGSPGVYALGRKRDKTFYPRYFGRSDSDVNAELKKHFGKYDAFKFEYFDSPEAAFTKECELYHDFRGPESRLDNKTHPDRSQGATWQCPKCNAFVSVGAAQTKNQFCLNCGSRIPIDSKFCPSCGTQPT
jgi:predicted RNA-binding Zn-ribbon protein involved in translation (DUF1610 family)